jgi:hypothetical protein
MSRSPVMRELLWLLAAALTGVLLLPPLIYAAGVRTFGAYAAGGARDLMSHFFQGLGQGGLAFWMVAAGPYVFITLARLAGHLLRRGPGQEP